MRALEGLLPKEVFYYFEEMSMIPRGSGNEKAASDYIVRFAEERGLFCRQDRVNNVFVKKPGTAGYEASPPVVLQGHLDIVCEKNAGTLHDFLKDPLKLAVNGDFISAEGTTLGADNGVALAYMLALLDSKDIPHPPLECIFTVDEEVGMLGANEFDFSLVTGRRLINMDTENEGILRVSCAGGIRAALSLLVEREAAPAGQNAYLLRISGLLGGHSGADIHLQRASANKLMGRALAGLKGFSWALADICGGKMDNAITREAEAVLVTDEKTAAAMSEEIKKIEEEFRNEYKTADPGISLKLEGHAAVSEVLSESSRDRIILALTLIPYGVKTVSLLMPGLVESSSNMGIVAIRGDKIAFESAVRSSVEIRKQVILEEIRAIAEALGGEVATHGDYPAWEYAPDSGLLRLFTEVYEETYGKRPLAEAIHAGLECGVFAGKAPGLDMISIGPDAYGAHSPDERLSISSTGRVWEFLKEALKRMK